MLPEKKKFRYAVPEEVPDKLQHYIKKSLKKHFKALTEDALSDEELRDVYCDLMGLETWSESCLAGKFMSEIGQLKRLCKEQMEEA